MRETASYELSCVKISSVDFPVEDGKKKRKGKGRHKKPRKRYISPIRGEAPRKRIFTKFCTSKDMLDVIICAIFGMEKLRGLGNTRGEILEFPIEMAGHLYNRAGATAQPVIQMKDMETRTITHCISSLQGVCRACYMPMNCRCYGNCVRPCCVITTPAKVTYRTILSGSVKLFQKLEWGRPD